MDACLTQSAPAPAIRPACPDVHPGGWVRRVLAAVIAVGLLWRAVRYFEQFPIWGDEAMLLLNILDRDYLGLTRHLDYAQVAPLLFLWLEKTALLTLGSAEWSVHFFPTLAGVLAFGIFARVCRVMFSPVAAGLAVGILAVSYYPVRHACEVKPYAFDLLYAVVFAWLTLEFLRRPERSRWLIALVGVTPLAVFSSYPSVFVGGAVSLVLLPVMRSASWSQRGLFGAYNLVLVGSFLIHYGLVGHSATDAEAARRSNEFLREYWKDAFPPAAVWQWPTWLLQVHTGNMLAYPLGAARGGSSATFLLVLLGSVALWRSRQRALLALCWLPFALNLLAAILGKYPFGGSARITQHLAPFICILMAHGFADLLERIRDPHWRTRTHLAFYALLLACGVGGVVRDLLHPYKTVHDRDIRLVALDLACKVAPDEPVLICHRGEKEILAELAWYLRTELPTLHWLSDPPSVGSSCWLVVCNHHEPGVTDAMTASGMSPTGWRVAETAVRVVQGENAKMATVYCRSVRLLRE